MEGGMIAVNNLTFGYRHDGFGLSIAELHIAKGERIAVIGPSGTGKTTLLNLLSGILLPTSGEIHFEGFNLPDIGIEDRQHLRALKMGLVFQEFELLEYLNVLDNILLSYRVSPVLELNGEVKERALQLAEDVGLGEKLKRFPHHLSQGERQRVAVCRALVTQPALILGDEPTGNLDPKNRDHIAEMLFHYTDETDAPLIVVTHDQELVTQFDRSIDVREYAS